MAELDPGQTQTRAHFESLITTVSPLFDLVLAVGERISRVAEPTDFEYYPIRDEEPDSGDSPSR
ncbi:MAG TPA: hypothetical protein VMF31_11715 [Solirubrobacterales bacterium]|nr:hypothetical protein [Solirubrobacterales bacterium]